MTGKRRLINNSISGLLQLIITALLTFVCIPIFINKLGTEQYGIFALVSVIGNLNLFTNLGLDSALTKFLAEQGKCANSDKDIISALLLSIIIIVPVGVIAFSFRNELLIELLKIPLDNYIVAERLFICLLIANSILLVGQTFTAMLNALQRIYLTNIIQLIYSIIYWLGIIIVVLMGYHLDIVGGVILIASLVWICLSVCIATYYWGKFDTKEDIHGIIYHAKKQIKYGMQLYTSGLIAFFNEPLFKIIISYYFGKTTVAYYEIALKIRGQLSGLFQKLVQPLFPYISQLIDKQFISTLIADLTKKIFLLALPICIILGFCCYDIVAIWLRKDVVNYTIFIIGIVIPYLFFSPLTLPIYLYLVAKGHPDKTIVIQLVTVVSNLVVFYFLYYFCDFYAIIISNGIAYFLSFYLGIHYQRKYLGTKFHINLRVIFKYILILLLYSIVGYIQLYISNEVVSVIFVVSVVLGITVIAYKHLQIISEDDILYYFSENKFIVSLYRKL